MCEKNRRKDDSGAADRTLFGVDAAYNLPELLYEGDERENKHNAYPFTTDSFISDTGWGLHSPNVNSIKARTAPTISKPNPQNAHGSVGFGSFWFGLFSFSINSTIAFKILSFSSGASR